MKTSNWEKIAFVFSLMALAYLGGYATRWHNWYPDTLLERASKQMTTLIGDWKIRGLKKRVYEWSGTRTVAPERMESGLTLITSYWTWEELGALTPGAKLIDQKGETIHEWSPDRTALFGEGNFMRGGSPEREDFAGSYLFPNGDLILVLDYVGAVRLNACGEIVWRVKKGNHHFFSRADDGSFWMAGTSPERRTTTDQYPDGFPGIDKPVWLDQILNLTSDGEVRKTINVLDVLYENDLERHIVKAFDSQARDVHPDVVHLNDVEPLSASMAKAYPMFDAGDLVVSLRKPSLVFVFDPDSGTVKWHESHSFLHQHDPDFTGDGWIGVFDNNYDLTERGTMLGGSRILSIQPHTDSTTIRFPTEHSDPLYTRVQGQWQELPNGNMLLVERDAGRVVEVAPDGRTVWEWVHAPYEESQVPIVSGAHRYDVTHEEASAWACSSTDSLQASAPSS